MRIPSSDVPQADRLDDVVRVVSVVREGVHTYQGIAEQIDKVGRQGRYYRLAAEILGLIRSEHNYAELTPTGEALLDASQAEQKRLLLEAVLNATLFQRVLAFLELHPRGVTGAELQEFMVAVTEPVGPSMMPRRARTVISWLMMLGLLRESGDRYVLVPEAIQGLPLPEFDVAEPLMPKSGALSEYKMVHERARKAGRRVRYVRDQAKTERANRAHDRLVRLVAQRLWRARAIPRRNAYIDLAARVASLPYIFEMKSTSARNFRSQMRLGLSQLYEYRYLQHLPGARLVLVVEAALPKSVEWMESYLREDRGVSLVWDGNNELYASRQTQEELSFLW